MHCILLLLLACLAGQKAAFAKSIVVGEGQGGWSIGVDYTPITASVGDELIFEYTTGVHDVWLMPSTACDFDAPGATLVGEPNAGTYTATLTKAGTYYYSCSTIGHCDAGQVLEVIVKDGSAPAPGTSPVLSFPIQSVSKGGGSCGPPSTDPSTKEVTVVCLSAPVSLAPGDNIYPDVPLPNPYPETGGPVIMRKVDSQIVDSTGRAVPLDEVYLHHTFGDIRFVPGEGAEARGSPTRIPLPEPYAVIVDGSEFADQDTRFVNFHVINTVGVAEEAVKQCIECWCPGTNPPVGSIGCCAKCNSTSTASAQEYFLQFNVTYSPATAEELAATETIVSVALDVHGGVDHSIAPGGPGSEAIISRTYPIDYYCPQDAPFQLVRCMAHQHIGGACIYMYNEATGEKLCESCPVYGTEKSVPGNEAGYLVGMTPQLLDPPLEIQPGQMVRMESVYNSSEPFAGVMSVMGLQFANFTAKEECNIPFDGFIQPPVAKNAGNATATLEGLEKLINTIPEKNCTKIRGYFDDVILPCAPVVLANISGGAMTMGDMATCCTGLKANEGALDSVFGEVYTQDKDAGCLCPLGETLLYSVQENLLGAVAGVSEMCSGEMGGGGPTNIESGIYVALNSLFAPQCPVVKSGLEAKGNSPAMSPMPSMVATDGPSSQEEPQVEEEEAAGPSSGALSLWQRCGTAMVLLGTAAAALLV